jgi:signal transduction histidine kinase
VSRLSRPYLEIIAAEGIAAMTFIPLVCQGRVIGKFMLYSEVRHAFTADQLQLAGVIAAQVAFAVVRARAEAAAEEANRLKDEFLATLSHELRAPLNAIVGWTRMLQQGTNLSPERVSHAIDVISRNAKLQTQLIADIVDATRIAAGKLEIERRPLARPTARRFGHHERDSPPPRRNGSRYCEGCRSALRAPRAITSAFIRFSATSCRMRSSSPLNTVSSASPVMSIRAR